MKVRIKRVDKSLPVPDYQSVGAAGFDMYSRVSETIAPGEYKVVPSNLVFETPEGYMLMIVPRSSTFKKKGLVLANSVAILDSDFRGDDDEMLLQFYNPTSQEAKIEKGERIAQGIFVKYEKAEWEEVEKMDNANRGGIGSTDEPKN